MSQFFVNEQASNLPGTVIETITGNDGTPEAGVAHNFNIVTANATPQFKGTAGTETLDFGLSNLLLGSSGSSITSGLENVGYGLGALVALTTGTGNVGAGFQSLFQTTSGAGNTALGLQALKFNNNSANVGIGELAGSVLTGSFNTIIGSNALSGGGASNNIVIGNTAANSYIGAESSNIIIGNVGVFGESNIIRVGTTGNGAAQQNKCFIAGITGVIIASSPCGISSTGQLSDLGYGSSGQVFTSNGPNVSPTWKASGVPTFPLSVPNGGTGVATLAQNGILFGNAASNVGVTAAANNGVLITSNTGTPSLLANGTAGQVLTANTAAPPSWQSLGHLNVTKTAISYTVLVTDDYIGVTSTAAPRTMSLVSANYASGDSWIIMDESGGASAHNITITPTSGTIQGQASYIINTNFESTQIIFDGTNYFVI